MAKRAMHWAAWMRPWKMENISNPLTCHLYFYRHIVSGVVTSEKVFQSIIVPECQVE